MSFPYTRHIPGRPECLSRIFGAHRSRLGPYKVTVDGKMSLLPGFNPGDTEDFHAVLFQQNNLVPGYHQVEIANMGQDPSGNVLDIVDVSFFMVLCVPRFMRAAVTGISDVNGSRLCLKTIWGVLSGYHILLLSACGLLRVGVGLQITTHSKSYFLYLYRMFYYISNHLVQHMIHLVPCKSTSL